MAQVEMDKLTKVYPGRVRAVDGVDLSIADREFVVLVGPSGCGKSTTLRMVAGLEEITGGTIRIGGRVVNGVAPKDRDIAMVFQNYALYPHMTVYKNLAFGLKLRRMPKKEIHSRVMQTAEMLEIGHLLDRKPRALSGGQRQRVAVGRAIVREPAAFLFDEPLSNLDAKLRVTTRAQLKRLHQRLRTTTIYVTHDQEEAMTLGERIVVMKDGRIQQADTPLKTYRRPANRFVAGFIGMPPMNFFDGLIRADAGKLVFEERAVSRSGELTDAPGGFTLEIPEPWRDALAGRKKKHVVLGIRPEHLSLSPMDDDQAASAAIRIWINVIEPLGNNMDITMRTALHDPVVARVEARTGLDAQTQATAFVDLRQVHFFEPGDTGMNLSRTSEPTHAIA